MRIRIVKYRKYLPATYTGTLQDKGSGEYTDYIYDGFFHRWANETVEGREGFGNYTVGLIQTPEGNIKKVDPEDIMFVKPKTQKAEEVK